MSRKEKWMKSTRPVKSILGIFLLIENYTYFLMLAPWSWYCQGFSFSFMFHISELKYTSLLFNEKTKNQQITYPYPENFTSLHWDLNLSSHLLCWIDSTLYHSPTQKLQRLYQKIIIAYLTNGIILFLIKA